jgi:predicted AlkP superfamily pyrophosphatase or phosphodiesterase
VPALLCLAEPRWSIWTHDFVAKLKGPLLGMHGHDNADPHMGALFVAEGPAFRRDSVHPAFDNVDVHPLLAHLLRTTAEKNDGNFSDVADMLKPGL